MSLPHKRSKVGNAAKRHKNNPNTETRAALDQARRELAEERITAYVEATVASATPLSDSALARLAALLAIPARRDAADEQVIAV